MYCIKSNNITITDYQFEKYHPLSYYIHLCINKNNKNKFNFQNKNYLKEFGNYRNLDFISN